MTVDDLAKVLGRPGRFQIVIFVFLSLNYTYVCWNHLGMAFIGAKTKHHCQVKNETEVSRLVPLVEKDGKKKWDGCHLYADYNKTEKISCPDGWTYYLPDREWTIVAEWDLVCDDSYKANLATTLYFCGVMLGGLVFGSLSDRFGRRSVFLFTMYSPALIGLVLFFTKNYLAFVALRFVLGFLLQGLQMVSFLLFIEVFAIQYRTAAGVCTGIFWSFGVMSLAFISYLIQDYRSIQLFTTMAGLLQIGMVCFLPESFRWLISNNRSEKAGVVVQKISSFNKLPFPRKVFDEVVDNSNTQKTDAPTFRKNYTILDIFRYSVLRKRSLILAIVWFSTSFSYYGLALNVSALAGSKYLNFFISGIFELAIAAAAVFLLQRFGRRRPLCAFSIVGGVTCILAGVLSKRRNLQGLTTALALCGRICVSGNFAIIFIYTSELYPTVIRNVGFGSGIFWARFGSIVAPQVLLLGKYTAGLVPFIIFGVFVSVAGTLGLQLPETLNMKLPETIEDAGRVEKMPQETVDMSPLNKNDACLINKTEDDLEP